MKTMTHPECLTDEIYYGNCSVNALHTCSWKTRRIGTTAFESDGTIETSMVPIFVKRAEISAKADAAKSDQTKKVLTYLSRLEKRIPCPVTTHAAVLP